MFCPKCGSQLPDGSKFCGNCGSPLQAAPAKSAQPQQPQAPTQAAAPSPAPAPAPVASGLNISRKAFIIGAVGAVAVIGGAAAVLTSRGGQASTTSGSSSDTGTEKKSSSSSSELSKDVTIKDLKITDISHSDYGYQYRIDASITNNTSRSLCVYPGVDATVTGVDKYGDPMTIDGVRIKEATNIYTFNDTHDNEMFGGVPMAPNESRSVEFYISASVLAKSIESASNSDEFDTSSKCTIDAIELARIDTLDAPDGYAYAAVDDIELDVSLKDNKFVGTVTNNTDKKWEEVQVRFKLTSSANPDEIGHDDAKGSYIKPGATLDVYMGTIVYDTATPTFLSYKIAD